MASKVPIIIAENVSKEYKRGKELIKAVANVNLEINSGDIVCFFGPSGSGKTTLLNVLSGLDQPTVGRVILDGSETGELDERLFPKIRREKIGFIFQDFNLIPELTVIENVSSPLWPTEMKSKKIEELAIATLREVDLLDRKDHLPKQLSGGEQQRTAIARALITKPKILFADEPTGNLDTKTGIEIMNLLKKINNKEGTTIIIVTHDENLLKFAKKVYKMVDGRVSPARI
ncbi:MAG: ABC transporter ATP-binding protein [Candidatus Odinarchaeia archaeon]